MSATPDDFTRLHTRDLGPDGRPLVREAFLSYLDTARNGTPTPPVLSLDAALLRLAAEEPLLSDYVERRYVARETVRIVAAALGVGPRQVHERAWRGLEMLSTWTGIASDVLILHLRTRSAR